MEELTYLRRAIAVSQRARDSGNHPFGAVLVAGDGRIVAEAENTVLTASDPTGHAETNLVRLAAGLVDDSELPHHTLYSSCEPCAMCSAAIFWSGIGRVVYALSNDALIAMLPAKEDPVLTLACRDVIGAGNRRITVEGPFIENEAAVAHEGFWA